MSDRHPAAASHRYPGLHAKLLCAQRNAEIHVAIYCGLPWVMARLAVSGATMNDGKVTDVLPKPVPRAGRRPRRHGVVRTTRWRFPT